MGLTPHKLAMAFAWGTIFGLFPVIGTTTALCAIAAVIFRLNMGAIQIANYMVYPLQIILIIPYIRLGEYIFNIPQFPLSISKLKIMFGESVWESLGILGNSILSGMFAWLLTAIPLFVILYFVSRGAFRRIIRRRNIRQGEGG